MGKVLLVDTSFSSIPIYDYLITEHDVYVVGNRSGDALAIRCQEKWIELDYSNTEKLKEIIESHRFDYLVPGCTDVSIRVCQELSESCQLFDSVQVYSHLSQKRLFRNLCKANHISCPLTYEAADFPIYGTFICKPVDSYSGNGVTVFDGSKENELREAIDNALIYSQSKEFVIEEFVEGQLYSYSTFIEQQKVMDSFIVLEGSSATSFAVDTSFLISDFPQDISETLKMSIERLASHLSLVDGLLHLQFILDKSGHPQFIEMTRRCPGDLYSMLIEYSSGYRYAAKYASYYICKRLSAEVESENLVIRHTLTSDHLESFNVLNFNEINTVKAFWPLIKLGENIRPNQKDR